MDRIVRQTATAFPATKPARFASVEHLDQIQLEEPLRVVVSNRIASALLVAV